MPNDFQYDVFLSHSAKDKAVVRVFSLSASNGERAGVRCRNLHSAERLRQDGRFKFGTRNSNFGISRLCMSAHAFGSDWAHLACPAAASARRGKAGTFRFRDPLNQERHFIPLRLDDAPIKGPLAQSFTSTGTGAEIMVPTRKD